MKHRQDRTSQEVISGILNNSGIYSIMRETRCLLNEEGEATVEDQLQTSCHQLLPPSCVLASRQPARIGEYNSALTFPLI